MCGLFLIFNIRNIFSYLFNYEEGVNCGGYSK